MVRLLSVCGLACLLLGCATRVSQPTDSAAPREVPSFTHILIDSTKQKWGDWAEPEWLRYFGQDEADIDHDGDLDILSGRYLYFNPGGNLEGKWRRQVLDDNVDGIFLIDVDGDAFSDLIAMALPDVYWYEATDADATAWRRTRVTQVPATSHVNSQGFERAQIVAGGREELLLAGNGDVYLIRIPDDPTTPWPTELIAPNTSDEGIGVGDLDGDGDLDLAVGRRPEGADEPTILVRYLNPGDGTTPWPSREVGTSEHPIDRVSVSDLNGDGRADIIVTEERYPGEEPDGNLWWYEQPAGEKSWERHRVVTQYSMNNLDVADIDGDGDVDILTNEHKGPRLELQFWLNDGRGNFTKRVVDTGKENHLGTQLVDLDNDGDLDIFGGAWDSYEFVHVWRNDERHNDLRTGAVFREYTWSPEVAGLSEEFLRVGGKLDYRNATGDTPSRFPDGSILLADHIPLSAVKEAEVVVQRVQSHEDTKSLQISFNDGPWIDIPEPATIPHPATDYMFHANVSVPVPPSTLLGGANRFKLRVADVQSWGWPQNLIYGVTLRTYMRNVPPVDAPALTVERAGTEAYDLSLEGGTEDVRRVEYVGRYTGVDPAGHGRARRFHYRLHGPGVDGHLGTATTPPFSVRWNTEWLPDQELPVEISARVHYRDGSIRLLEPRSVVHADRDASVYFARPAGVPAFWVTRNRAYSQNFHLPLDPTSVTDARLTWNAWSPCYSAGITLNQVDVSAEAPGPCYRADRRELRVSPAHLRAGENTLTTLQTPLHDGEMVHGMEVQYPGFALLVRRQPVDSVRITTATYEDRPHFVVTTPAATYYYDRAGGGLSRLIDPRGSDWIAYRTEPWDQYPASAAGAYRGMPNLVFGGPHGGAGHPGHDRMTSRIAAPDRIISTTPDGQWEWTWSFTPTGARLDVTTVPPDATYWFLYEGTPGGSYDPENFLYAIDDRDPVGETPDFYRGESRFTPMRQIRIGDRELPYMLRITHLTETPSESVIGLLGNTETGVGSPDGMVVFGFGRTEGTSAVLRGPQSFHIDFQPHRPSTGK
ncbi:VCBS repeat-containing protein [Lewinella sp. JB7]|uniref:FG-GAP repeat domain-containing protein n=1 Tax=Lewinella sp. JB7 TaxID=2962887 RepID=UPI0020C9B140|nr:VCBS repeat-containing protein [Lewinella sp. JB7]MCP9237833.1 VCBS repeat-containing protein [Lewinella sp. JB7]